MRTTDALERSMVTEAGGPPREVESGITLFITQRILKPVSRAEPLLEAPACSVRP